MLTKSSKGAGQSAKQRVYRGSTQSIKNSMRKSVLKEIRIGAGYLSCTNIENVLTLNEKNIVRLFITLISKIPILYNSSLYVFSHFLINLLYKIY